MAAKPDPWAGIDFEEIQVSFSSPAGLFFGILGSSFLDLLNIIIQAMSSVWNLTFYIKFVEYNFPALKLFSLIFL